MSYTNLLYHIVFGTKGRLPLITDEIKPRLYEYLGGTVRGLGGIAFEIKGIADHVHLFVKIPPTVKFSDFLRDLKANSSKWVNENTNEKFAWQRRYGAFTVSESQVEIIRDYIRKQEEHHRKFDFKSEFESLLKVNKIEIDDFVWQD
ncbi:MAG: IS200/IS605 family transposase [Pyrinomonadaceae bacterium]|nr:IS200/IS605 family transposase [Pyrinomonadaceae bacterium]